MTSKACPLLALLFVLAISSGGHVYAQTQGAAVLQEQAFAAYGEGRFDDAATLFGRAYDALRDPTLLENQALATERAARPADALRLYEAHLREHPDAPTHREIETRTTRLRAEIAYGAGLWREASDLFATAFAHDPNPIYLYNRGRSLEHLNEADAAIDAYQRYLATHPENAQAVEERVAALRAVEERHDTTNTNDARTVRDERSISPIPWVIAGVGAVGALVGVAFAVVSQDDWNTAANPSTPLGRALEAEAEANAFATVANTLFIAGGALVAIGATWGIIDLLTRPDDHRDDEVRVSFGLGSVWVRGAL